MSICIMYYNIIIVIMSRINQYRSEYLSIVQCVQTCFYARIYTSTLYTYLRVRCSHTCVYTYTEIYNVYKIHVDCVWFSVLCYVAVEITLVTEGYIFIIYILQVGIYRNIGIGSVKSMEKTRRAENATTRQRFLRLIGIV